LTHSSGLTLSNFSSKLPVLNEILFQDKHENVNIMDFNPRLVAPIVSVPRIDNNSSKLLAFEENFIERTGMQNLVSKRWTNMLEEEASNSNSDDYDDLVQSLCRTRKLHKNTFLTVEKSLK